MLFSGPASAAAAAVQVMNDLFLFALRHSCSRWSLLSMMDVEAFGSARPDFNSHS